MATVFLDVNFTPVIVLGITALVVIAAILGVLVWLAVKLLRRLAGKRR